MSVLGSLGVLLWPAFVLVSDPVRAKVMEKAAELAAEECREIGEGCDFEMSVYKQEIYVSVRKNTRSTKGELLDIPGAGMSYVFTLDGTYLREMPDL